MATSGSFTGNRSSGASSSSPRLILDWRRVQTDISRNRSKIRLTLKLDIDGRVNFSANKTGSLHGSSFTFTGGISASSTTRTLRTRDVWVNHNSDGSKSQSFSASFNINISYSSVRINNLSVSGTANITSIPRASGFTAFSLSSSSIAKSTSRTIRYTLDRKSSSFSHDMRLRIGNKTIVSWSTSSTGSLTRTLTSSQANTILNALSNTTSGTLSLRMITKSGSTTIGSSVTRETNISVASSVSPSASGISTSISGSGRDDAISRYVQSITRVYASFSRSAGYGASISSSSIVVRRVSGGSNSQTISGRSGTTSNPVSLSGTYEAIGRVKDSRGRSDTSRTTFTVQSYSSPRISKFTAARTTSNPATVSVTRTGGYTSLSSLNPTDVEVHKRARNSTSWSRINSLLGHTNGSFGLTFSNSGNSEASAYEFRLTVTDSFGNSARSTVDVGTSFQELTIARGQGIGVGKVWERGALDVAGVAYFDGRIFADNATFGGNVTVSGASGLFTNSVDHNGAGEHLYIRPTSTGEARVTSVGSTTSYRPLKASSFSGNELEVNSSTHLYLKPTSSGEVRVTVRGSTSSYRDLRANNIRAQLGVFTNSVNHNGVGSHLYIRPASTGEVRTTRAGTTGTYVPLRTDSVYYESGLSEFYRTRYSVAELRNNGRLRYEQENGVEVFAIRGDIGGSNNKSIRLSGLSNYTTSSSANMYISGSYNVLRSTSAKKYKKDIEPLEESYAEQFFENAQPVWFRSKCNADPDHYGYYGYIADDVAEFEPRLVKFLDYDEDGNKLFKDGESPTVEGFHYDRVPALLHKIMKKDRKRIEALERKLSKVSADKNRINDILERLEALEEGV